ncbi:MAG: tail fiber domain-containing protein [Acidobacteria bacterium]|nr:tail fiber domain-containing protein [Acidobacteriota bacterium]
MKTRRMFSVFILVLAAYGIFVVADQKVHPLAVPEFYPDGVEWYPLVDDARFLLRVACPDGTVLERSFEFGYAPVFSVLDQEGSVTTDGLYTYELVRIPLGPPRSQRDALAEKQMARSGQPVAQSGHFRIMDGVVVTSGEADEGDARKDIVHADDVIIDGSLCVGNDCYSGLAFGFDTQVFMENNLRIFFDDTSTIQNYPRNDWRIIVNDSIDGGGDYFAIEDATAAEQIFKLEAGAPANSLYVDSHGDVGINTATPYYELHIVDGDSPAVRLEQDTSYGWPSQKWDLCGNESNFFIRDATHASKLPFRIEPEAPTNTIFLQSDGNVGIGTGVPQASVHIQATGDRATLLLERTDGATTFFASKTNNANFGSASNHPLRLVVNTAWIMQLNANESLEMKNGAVCTTAGQWQDASSREYKENIHALSRADAAAALEALQPVRFTYKSDAAEECLGFIAEDVPDLVATASRKTMSSMDVVAVLTKVVQEQQRLVQEQQRAIDELRRKVAELEDRSSDK